MPTKMEFANEPFLWCMGLLDVNCVWVYATPNYFNQIFENDFGNYEHEQFDLIVICHK